MIFTTPRKNPEEFDSLWATELPPIHLFWFTSKSLKILARRIEMSYFEINYSANSSRYISNSLARPTLNKELFPLKNKAKVVSIKTLLLSITPSFIKHYYYIYIKKTTRYCSSLGSTIYFGFKNLE